MPHGRVTGAIADSPAKTDGIAVGLQAAQAIIALRTVTGV
jgi:hypothetical protein